MFDCFEESLLLLPGTEPFAFSTANRTEMMHLSAHPADVMNTLAAVEVVAAEAVARGRLVMMVGAGKDTFIQQNRLRGLGWRVHLRDYHHDFTAFPNQLDFAQMQGLPFVEVGFLDRLAVNEASVGGVEIPDREGSASDGDDAVMIGDTGMFDGKVIRRAAPERVETRG